MSITNIPAVAAEAQHLALGLVSRDNAEHTTHPEAQWFPKAGLGLFVHWGIASVHGSLDLSWSMMANTGYDAAVDFKNKLTPEEYWRLADRFNPEDYNPDRWLAAAASAGCQYAVLTAMHHDGYTLWPSRFSEIGVQTSLNGRDLVAPFVEACRKHGLKVGIYYSPPDWYFDRQYMSFNYGSANQERFPGRVHFDTNHQPVELPPMPEAHRRRGNENYLGRIRELLTRYGRVDLLWLDGGGKDNAVRDLARQLQPHIVLNQRSCDGDYTHTECSLPAERVSGWFETCHCWQKSTAPSPHGGTVDFWGYLKSEQYKSTAWMLETLVRLRAWGGNLLVNVGPRPDGELPAVVYDRLKEAADWMAHSRESVIGTVAGTFPEHCNVPMTRSNRFAYLHVLPGFDAPVRVEQIARPASVRLLRTGQPLEFQWEDGILQLSLPAALRTSLVDVVSVEAT
jgi:alpha-L-fucosidase